MYNRLTWTEKTPLILGMAAQCYQVFLWYGHAIHGLDPRIDYLFAGTASIALDAMIVAVAVGRRSGRSGIWSWLTLLCMAVFSCSIAIDLYGWQWESLLHMAFPCGVLLYSLHLGQPVADNLPQQELATASKLPDKPASLPELPNDASKEPAKLPGLPDQATSTLANSYRCPSCGSQLASKGLLGLAKRYGHCKECKQ
jgi:hypothetical protein